MFKPSQKKFRAWDSVNKKWVIVGFDIQGETTYFDVIRGYSLENALELEITQFTGLKDSKGNEIYEGDILDIGEKEPALVQYKERFASFCLEKEGWGFSHYFGEAIEPKECTIVGNIFENPNLL